MPVGGIDRMSRAQDEQQHDSDFHEHNDVVDRCGLANADHQQDTDNAADDNRR